MWFACSDKKVNATWGVGVVDGSRSKICNYKYCMHVYSNIGKNVICNKISCK